jgi:hypothetical protein
MSDAINFKLNFVFLSPKCDAGLLSSVSSFMGAIFYAEHNWTNKLNNYVWPALLKAETVRQALLTKAWIKSGLFEMNPPPIVRQKHGDK